LCFLPTTSRPLTLSICLDENLFEKDFHFYFLVFNITENLDQTENIFDHDQKNLLQTA